jgi:hypothetical protein
MPKTVSVFFTFFLMPHTENEWLQVSTEYDRKWNFPHCLGVMDGKHVALQDPTNSASDYFNYKVFLSIVLLALVDADYCFLYADVGCQGRISDGGVFRNTILFQKIESNIFICVFPSILQ